MPAQRPRASFEPIPPDFDLKKLVESTPNFSYVDRISVDMIDQQGMAAFEKLVTLHVVVGGKPLVVDGFEDRLDPWTFTPKWLRDNCGEKVENARNLTAKENLPLTMGHYLKNMGLLTNQFFNDFGAYKEKGRQRVYLKDIDCPDVWWDKLKEHLPPVLTYLNDSTGEVGGPGAVPDPQSTVPGRRLGRGIARAGDLMSSLPPDMRAENLMCYIGHEGTYTPAHREMCASLGQNIMVEASNTVSDNGKAEKPGSSIWFMTESKDRHLVSEYWLSVLGHDIEVENHFAQVVAWKKAPFHVYVVEQRPGDFILIPPLAPHQVWNRGTRTMKVAWNRTTVETLEMAINEALPRSRIVCRDEQYKNKAIIYYTLTKYQALLFQAIGQSGRMSPTDAHQFLYTGKIHKLQREFKRLFNLYKQILLGEMFNPEDRDNPKSMEYLPFDSNVTCAYCRCNIFNRFLTCGNCKDLLGHHADEEDGDPYDVCLDCYAMGRSCGCLSGLKWVEQFRWKELASKYEQWRLLIIRLEGQNEKTSLPLVEERKRYGTGKKTLTEVCKEQLKRRPFKDIKNPTQELKEDEESDEEIVVGGDGQVKKITKKKSKNWLKSNQPCHVCCHRHPTWKMAKCTTCDRSWCYGSLFRGWDKMPIEIMEDKDWQCPHCLGICFAGNCKREGKMQPYEPKGTLLGHDTKKVADVRSVEALVDFSVSNLNWLKDDDPANRAQSRRLLKAKAQAQKEKEVDPSQDADEEADHVVNETQLEMEDIQADDNLIDPALGGSSAIPSTTRRRKAQDNATTDAREEMDEAELARRLRGEVSSLPGPSEMAAGAAVNGNGNGPGPDGYTALTGAGYSGYGAPPATMYPDPDGTSYHYPSYNYEDASMEPVGQEGLRPFKKRRRTSGGEDDEEAIAMHKGKQKKPRLAAAGFRSYDLAGDAEGAMASKAKSDVQREYEKEKEKKALERAKAEGRFIMLQAALKGKKRIVKLPVSGSRLSQALAQQAARTAQAALNAGEEADAEHEVGESAQAEDDTAEDMLLKSDIAPKKTKDHRKEYERKVRDGMIVTSTTKKALIPVEKDENYGYRGRERVNGKRREREVTALPPTAASKRNRRSHAGRVNVEYEEVDVGSEEDFVDGAGGFATINGQAKDRRSLPGYLQSRHTDDDPHAPSELPDDFRDGHNPKRAAKEAARVARRQNETAASEQLHQETEAAVEETPLRARSSQTAGKRPSMRPATATDLIAISDNEESEDEDLEEDATNGLFVPPAHGTFLTNGNKATSTRPAPAPARAAAPSRPTQRQLAQQAINEENRLAKLQALEMLDGKDYGASSSSAGAGGGALFDDDEEESDDDDMDEIPARVKA